MIVGFLGKGGSGKTTTSTLFIKYLQLKGGKVLAIDADYNQDLVYNFVGEDQHFKPLNESKADFLKFCGLQSNQELKDIYLSGAYNKIFFTLNESDPFISLYSQKIDKNLSIMGIGEHNDTVLHDLSCSHVLASSLKYYLPLIRLREDEYVIVDETAGTDSVGTGVTTGFDCAIVCAEPTRHSLKVACEIIKYLEFFETPYISLITKFQGSSDLKIIKEYLSVFSVLDFDSKLINNLDVISPQHVTSFDEVYTHIQSIKSSSRLDRTLSKLHRNEEYKKQSF